MRRASVFILALVSVGLALPLSVGCASSPVPLDKRTDVDWLPAKYAETLEQWMIKHDIRTERVSELVPRLWAWRFGPSAGLAITSVDAAGRLGVYGAFDVHYGIDDAWSVGGFAGGLYRPEGGLDGLFFGGAELLYALDIVQFVPLIGVGIGVVGGTGELAGGAQPALFVRGGLDYMWDREHTAGLDIRVGYSPVAQHAGVGDVMVLIGARISFVRRPFGF